jgi:GNAT superfamily N-acetyltransferase
MMTPFVAALEKVHDVKRFNCGNDALARLGVQQGEQGKHYGENLLGDAMRRARAAALEVGGWSLFVNAKGDEAAGFYRKYGFISLPSNPLVLFMPFANMPE